MTIINLMEYRITKYNITNNSEMKAIKISVVHYVDEPDEQLMNINKNTDKSMLPKDLIDIKPGFDYFWMVNIPATDKYPKCKWSGNSKELIRFKYQSQLINSICNCQNPQTEKCVLSGTLFCIKCLKPIGKTKNE